MSRRHARMRVVCRECGYLDDPAREVFKVGLMRRDMGKRRTRKALGAAGKRAYRRYKALAARRGW